MVLGIGDEWAVVPGVRGAIVIIIGVGIIADAIAVAVLVFGRVARESVAGVWVAVVIIIGVACVAGGITIQIGLVTVGGCRAVVAAITFAIPVAVSVFGWVGGEGIFDVGMAVVIAVRDAMAAIGVIRRARRLIYQDWQILRCAEVPDGAIPTTVCCIALAILSGDCRAA